MNSMSESLVISSGMSKAEMTMMSDMEFGVRDNYKVKTTSVFDVVVGNQVILYDGKVCNVAGRDGLRTLLEDVSTGSTDWSDDRMFDVIIGMRISKVWFRNGYITDKILNTIKECLYRADEMGNEVLAIIACHICYYDESLPKSEVLKILDTTLEETVNMLFQNRGVGFPSHDDENFVMYLLGWDNYGELQNIIGHGGYADLIIKDTQDGRHRYYIKARKEN